MSRSIIFSSALFSTALMLPVSVNCFVLRYDIPNDHSNQQPNVYIGQPVRMNLARVYLGLEQGSHVAPPSIVTPYMFINSVTLFRTYTDCTMVQGEV